MFMIGVINIYHFWWPQMVICLWSVLSTYIIVGGHRWSYGYDWCYQHISLLVATVGHMVIIGVINIYHCRWPQMVICLWLVLSTYIIVSDHIWSYVYDWCYQHIPLLVATDGHIFMIDIINIYHCWWPQMVIWMWLVLSTYIIVGGHRWPYGYDWCYQHISLLVATDGHMVMIGVINIYHCW